MEINIIPYSICSLERMRVVQGDKYTWAVFLLNAVMIVTIALMITCSHSNSVLDNSTTDDDSIDYVRPVMCNNSRE